MLNHFVAKIFVSAILKALTFDNTEFALISHVLLYFPQVHIEQASASLIMIWALNILSLNVLIFLFVFGHLNFIVQVTQP